MSSSSGCLSSNHSIPTSDTNNNNVNKIIFDINVKRNKCPLHGKYLVDDYRHVDAHISSDEEDEDEGLHCSSISSSDSNIADDFSIDATDSKIQSLFNSINISKDMELRNDKVINSEHSFRVEELESKLARGLSPPRATQKNNRKWRLTPVEKREIPCQSFAAKYILEHVPESCMSPNFYNYHRALLFFGDTAAKGVTETYPYSNRSEAHPIIQSEEEYINDDTLRRCYETRKYGHRFC